MSHSSPALLVVLIIFFVSLCAAPAAHAGTFDRDTTWAHTGLAASPADGSARWAALAMLPDGRFLAAGRTPGGQAAVARFTAAGELDPTWAADQPVPGLLVVSAQNAVLPAALIVRPDGTVLLGGTTLAVDSTPSLLVARLTADGHLDPTFATGGKLITTSGGEAELGNLAVTADGHILAAATSGTTGVLVRLTASGVARRDLRERRRGPHRPRRRRHDLLRPRARRRGPHLPRRQPGDHAAPPDGRRPRSPPPARWTRPTAPPATGPPTSTALPRPSTRSMARRLRVDADGTALVLSTVKSATGPATHLVGLARLTPGRRAGRVVRHRRHAHAGRLPLARHRHDEPRDAPGRLRRRRRDGRRLHHPVRAGDVQGGRHRHRRREPGRRHRRPGPDRRAGRHAAGPPARGRHQPDAERAEPERDRPPRRRRPRAARAT